MKKLAPMSLVFPAMTVLIVLIGTFVYYNVTSKIIENEVTASIELALKQSQANLSYKLSISKSLSDKFFMDPRTKKLLLMKDNAPLIDVIQLLKELKEMLLVIPLDESKTMTVRLYTRQPFIAQDKTNFFPLDNIENEEWYFGAISKMGGIHWGETHEEYYPGEGNILVISCTRVLKQSFNYYENNGVLSINIMESVLSDVLNEISFNKNEDTYIVNDDGIVMSCNNKSLIGTKVLNDAELKIINGAESGTYKVPDNKYLIYNTIEPIGWKLVTLINRDTIIKNNTLFVNLFIIVMVIAFFLALFLTNLIITSYSISQAGLREEQAKLSALQAQINPHFLYNTLDTINWLAIKSGNEKISGLINSLSTYFRLTLNKGRDIVTLRDELELAHAYLEIQNARFRESIAYEIINTQGLATENYMIPKLSFQPIIENAILHGIQKKPSRNGSITLRLYDDGDRVKIEIIDDGAGMDDKTISEMLHNSEKDKKTGYGISNVYQRLMIFNGGKPGLSIKSEYGKGTTVVISIKKASMP